MSKRKASDPKAPPPAHPLQINKADLAGIKKKTTFAKFETSIPNSEFLSSAPPPLSSSPEERRGKGSWMGKGKGGGVRRNEGDKERKLERNYVEYEKVEEVQDEYHEFPKALDFKFVEKIYLNLQKRNFKNSIVHHLEYSGFLEEYLWKFFDEKCEKNKFFMFLIAILINEKCRENMSPWDVLFKKGKEDADKFEKFFFGFLKFFESFESENLSLREKVIWVQLLNNCFLCLEKAPVKACCLKLASLPLWMNVEKKRMENIMEKGGASQNLKKIWKKIQKKFASPPPGSDLHLQRFFMFDLLRNFLNFLDNPGKNLRNPCFFPFLERFVEFLIDLLSQLATRRVINPLILEINFVVKCQKFVEKIKESTEVDGFAEEPAMSDGENAPQNVEKSPKYRLFEQLVDIVAFYESFEVDDISGEPLTEAQRDGRRHQDYKNLQRFCFSGHKEDLRSLWMANVGLIDTPQGVRKVFGEVPTDLLFEICEKALGLKVEAKEGGEREQKRQRMEEEEGQGRDMEREFLMDVLISRLSKRPSQLEDINARPLMPSETLLWDTNLVPEEFYAGEYSLALPKLNLQFLTIHDYLLRNFNLFRLESAYEIREDLHDCLPKLKAKKVVDRDSNQHRTKFHGVSRMASSLLSVENFEVKQARVGEKHPAQVKCDIIFDISQFKGETREEWDNLREHDVIFLVSLDPDEDQAVDTSVGVGKIPRGLKVEDFPSYFGVKAVRGAEVVELYDEEENLINEPNPMERKAPVGALRRARVVLDPAQYYLDEQEGRVGVYEGLNVIVRRKPKTNNFKSILSTIRQLMNDSSDLIVPPWLLDIFLGYGDPSAAFWRNLPENMKILKADFGDTFLDAAHLRESFPEAKVKVPAGETPRYALEFDRESYGHPGETIKASIVKKEAESPYPSPPPQENVVRFTPTQVEAIRSGVSQGLTMIVGPPGTGKTDCAVQIVSLIYQNFPEQKTLLVAHSNQALNDLFTKIKQLGNIPERHLLRLGRGESLLASEEDFSKVGRVRHMIERRKHLLWEVHRLATAIAQPADDWSFSCENAEQFYEVIIRTEIEKFQKKMEKLKTKSEVSLEEVGEQLGEAQKVIGRSLLFEEEKKIQKQKEEEEEEKKNAEESPKNKKPEDAQFDSEELMKDDELKESKKAEKSEKKDKDEIDEKEEKEENMKISKILLERYGSIEAVFFPFSKFFEDTPSPFLPVENPKIHAKNCELGIKHILKLFKDVAECRPFEMLRTMRERGDYLLTTQAKIIAMTCTHAALVRQQLVDLNFKYDNLVMEEAAQILEVETFIPMLLQHADPVHGSRLKRVCLLGDHKQLPPVVKNRAFQKYGKLDQSLFTRFIRLQTPHITLDKQGRARPSIANLYNWRYQEEPREGVPSPLALGNLPIVSGPEYEKANPGLGYDFQFINVEDYNGQGETQPFPYFYQNRGEAEFCVSVFMYLRLLGYPADKVTILSTYNGQKHLIRDILKQRCSWNPLFGSPLKVTTVDRYQGQQNDIVLLSLVRTRNFGHIRDIRRLVVGLSRARLGLYVFGRMSLFERCVEMAPVMNMFKEKSLRLALTSPLGEEKYGASERKVGEDVQVAEVEGVEQMWGVLQDLTKQEMALAQEENAGNK